jgi:hypothetical protein
MNVLILGTRKDAVLDHLSHPFLLIDDGELIDAVELPPRKSVTAFDFRKHSFNPLKHINYQRAREFVNILDVIFPEGQGTLTRKNGNFILLNALLKEPKTLDTILFPKSNDPAHTEAYQKIQTLLLSPVLKDVLNRPTNVSAKGTLLARLPRAELGDFDAFVLGNLLVSLYPGQVVLPDFGFYAHASHVSLIRQNRLVAGVNSLAEVPAFQSQLLLIDKKIASHATSDDAKVLAAYEGLLPGTNAYNHFIDSCIT